MKSLRIAYLVGSLKRVEVYLSRIPRVTGIGCHTVTSAHRITSQR